MHTTFALRNIVMYQVVKILADHEGYVMVDTLVLVGRQCVNKRCVSNKVTMKKKVLWRGSLCYPHGGRRLRKEENHLT